MKKIFIVVILLLLVGVVGCRDNVYGSEILIFELENNNYKVVGVNDDLIGNKKFSLEIPEFFQDKKVTSIGDYAFANTNLESIKIPVSISVIGSFAFYNSSLKTIDIPANVEQLNTSAFNNCEYLTSIYVDENNTNFSSLDGVLFNNDQTEIKIYPYGKQDLVYDVPLTVSSMSNIYNKYLETVNIHKDVYFSASPSFTYQTTIKNYHVDPHNPGFASVDGVLFTQDLKELVLYPSGRTDTTYTIPDGVTFIHRSAFAYSNLVDITFPESVEIINNHAFSNSKFLTTINISKNVSYLGSFMGCSSLDSINVDSENQNYSSVDGVLFNKDQTELIQYPQAKEDIEYTIPEGVEEISVLNNQYIKTLNITKDVMSISYISLTELENINVASENNEYSSEDGVLYNKDQTKLIHYPVARTSPFTVPDGVSIIGVSAFAGSKCSNVILSEGVITIEENAFRNANIESITLPNSLVQIDGFAFSGVENLTSIIIPRSVTSIDYGVFSEAANLVIYCEADEKPAGWDDYWRSNNINVVWGH